MCDLGGTTFAFYRTRKGAQQRHAVVVAALTRHVRKLPGAAALVDLDRGLEMAKHKTYRGHGCESLFL